MTAHAPDRSPAPASGGLRLAAVVVGLSRAGEAAGREVPLSGSEAVGGSLWPPLLAAGIIVLAVLVIIHLARRRPRNDDSVAEPSRPRVILGSHTGRRPGRSAELMGELKRREDSLESFVDTGSTGLKRKIVDIRDSEARNTNPQARGES